jgi:tetratricopeptide (TPR) repeat protein
MTRRCVAIVAGAAVIVWASTAAAQAQSDVRLISAWQKAVVAHAPGKLDQGVLTISTWSAADLEVIVSAYMQGNGLSLAGSFLRRAAILHTDIALLAPNDMSRQSGPNAVATVVDGKVVGEEGLSAHWSVARRLLDAAAGSGDVHREFTRAWYRATLTALVQDLQLADAASHLDTALKRFPDDAPLQVEAGCYWEAVARVRSQVTKGIFSGASGSINKAAARFGRALALDPGFVEARVRLGHVLLAQKSWAAASRELIPVYDAAVDPSLAYLVAMFLGRAEEQSGQLESAVSRYRRAAELCPYAQSPLLAMSRLARQTGDRAGARRVLDCVMSLPADETRRWDPWLEYYRWRVHDASTLLDAVRAMARAEPRS